MFGEEKKVDRYTIIDDDYTLTEEQMEKYKYIKRSEFGNRVIDYVDLLYTYNNVIEDDLKTFKSCVKKENISENSRKIGYEIVIDTGADFSKIEEYVKNEEEKVLKEIEEMEKESEEAKKREEEELKKVQEATKKSESSISKIPYAGLEVSKVAYVVSINIVALIIVLFIVILKGERKKNKK